MLNSPLSLRCLGKLIATLYSELPGEQHIVVHQEEKTFRFLSECMRYLFSATLQMNVVFFFLRCLL